jgi:hypothetical protein
MSTIAAAQQSLLAEGNFWHGQLALREVSSRLHIHINHGQSGTIFGEPRHSTELAACASYCNVEFSLYGKPKEIFLRVVALFVEMIYLIMHGSLAPKRPTRSGRLFSCHSEAIHSDFRIIRPNAIAPLLTALRSLNGLLEYHVFLPSERSTDGDTV